MDNITVRSFETRNDANYNNRHVVVNEEIEFFAFPFQGYSVNLNSKRAEVSHLTGNWSASIWQNFPDGKSKPLDHKFFEEKNDAFIWAYQQLKA